MWENMEKSFRGKCFQNITLKIWGGGDMIALEVAKEGGGSVNYVENREGGGGGM